MVWVAFPAELWRGSVSLPFWRRFRKHLWRQPRIDLVELAVSRLSQIHRRLSSVSQRQSSVDRMVVPFFADLGKKLPKVSEKKMKKIFRVVMAGWFSAMSLMFVSSAFAVTQYKVLYNFKGNANGGDAGNPYSALVMDAAGNLYGTTVNGGFRNVGTVFELSPQSGGVWSETIVHTFTDFSSDGTEPYASLTFDASGNLYGTTWGGGVNGYGVVFELSPQGGGVWSESILHSFPGSSSDGQRPYSGVVFDNAGNLFGATNAGGLSCGCGSLYMLTPSGGSWTEKIVRNFTSTGRDGWSPYTGNLTFDSLGNLYGATLQGGSGGAGAIFEFKPKSGGGLSESIVYDFTSAGGEPYNGLLVDATGNIYATIYGGGGHNGGAAVEFMPKPTGGWTGEGLAQL